MTTPDAGAWLWEPAPAKINLYLHVLGKRADGYHLLDSLVVFAGVHDRVAVAPGDVLRLEVTGQFADDLFGPDEDNLVIRAARALADRTGAVPRAAIRLTKRLPVASGIGGGSADAAAVLRALVRLWDVDPGEDALRTVALSIGADVPVCLDGRALFVGGIGEALTPAPRLPAAWFVLVNPAAPLVTAEVFGAHRGIYSGSGRFQESPDDVDAFATLLATRANDLEATARDLAPEVCDALELIAAQPGCRCARMSGSGATCFGLFASGAEAEAGARAIGKSRSSWWSVATPLVQSLSDFAADVTVRNSPDG